MGRRHLRRLRRRLGAARPWAGDRARRLAARAARAHRPALCAPQRGAACLAWRAPPGRARAPAVAGDPGADQLHAEPVHLPAEHRQPGRPAARPVVVVAPDRRDGAGRAHRGRADDRRVRPHDDAARRCREPRRARARGCAARLPPQHHDGAEPAPAADDAPPARAPPRRDRRPLAAQHHAARMEMVRRRLAWRAAELGAGRALRMAARARGRAAARQRRDGVPVRAAGRRRGGHAGGQPAELRAHAHRLRKRRADLGGATRTDRRSGAAAAVAPHRSVRAVIPPSGRERAARSRARRLARAVAATARRRTGGVGGAQRLR